MSTNNQTQGIIMDVKEPINRNVIGGYPIVSQKIKDNSEFVTSSDTYKTNKVKRKSLKDERRLRFINAISRYTKCLLYIESYMKVGQKLNKKYYHSSVVKELAGIHNAHKLDFIKVKLFEILLTLSTTDRTSLIFNKDLESRILRDLWIEYCDCFKGHISGWRLENGKKIQL